jgi:nucleotide-binding universal stress UspA family protein
MSAELIVGVDGSQESAIALDWALRYASRRGLAVKLLHAFALPLPDAYGLMLVQPDLDQWTAYAKQLVAAAERIARENHPEVPVDTALRQGPPAAVLIESSHRAAGIVLGTRGAGAIAGRLIGSVSVRVALKAACPVYVIPPEWTPMETLGPVVVGVDGSEFSDAALKVAVDEARSLGVGLRAVIAYHVAYLARPIEPELIARFHESERELARQTVERALDRVRCDRSQVPVEVQVVDAPPADALIAAGQEAALIVVGSRGRGAVSRALLGSVSRSVMQHSHRPLCVVHRPRESQPG